MVTAVDAVFAETFLTTKDSFGLKTGVKPTHFAVRVQCVCRVLYS